MKRRSSVSLRFFAIMICFAAANRCEKAGSGLTGLRPNTELQSETPANHEIEVSTYVARCIVAVVDIDCQVKQKGWGRQVDDDMKSLRCLGRDFSSFTCLSLNFIILKT